MKKILLITIALVITHASFAQWNTSGSNIYYNSGNVGIGTASPQAALSVKGSALPSTPWSGYTSSLQVGELMIQDYNVVPQVGISQNSYYDGISNKYIANGYATGMYMGANGSITFSVFNSGTIGNALSGTGTAMTIANNGNIGIGAPTVPNDYKLAVNGAAIATSMTVKLYGNWPDYVFHKDYILPTLTEVKTYINRNQHLPDMPSEQEVKDKGINLGELVKVQTKKIEELTLYLIEEHDRNAKQENRIKALEARLEKMTN